MRKTSAHFSELYLHKLDKLAELESHKIKYFWSQREWHPVIKMLWESETVSNGEGLITYPDGSTRAYELPARG